jgi:hypothetical protein
MAGTFLSGLMGLGLILDGDTAASCSVCKGNFPSSDKWSGTTSKFFQFGASDGKRLTMSVDLLDRTTLNEEGRAHLVALLLSVILEGQTDRRSSAAYHTSVAAATLDPPSLDIH